MLRSKKYKTVIRHSGRARKPVNYNFDFKNEDYNLDNQKIEVKVRSKKIADENNQAKTRARKLVCYKSDDEKKMQDADYNMKNKIVEKKSQNKEEKTPVRITRLTKSSPKTVRKSSGRARKIINYNLEVILDNEDDDEFVIPVKRTTREVGKSVESTEKTTKKTDQKQSEAKATKKSTRVLLKRKTKQIVSLKDVLASSDDDENDADEEFVLKKSSKNTKRN